MIQHSFSISVILISAMLSGTAGAQNSSSNIGERSRQGMTTSGLNANPVQIYQENGRFYLQLADSVLGRDMLVVTRILEASAAVDLTVNKNAGDKVNEYTIRFERGPGNKLLLKTTLFNKNSSDTTHNGLYKAVTNANLQPIGSSFEFLVSNKHPNLVITDLTGYLEQDHDGLFFSDEARSEMGLAACQADKSWILSTKSFPSSVVINALRTYTKTTKGTVTVKLCATMLLLPKEPMRPRYADARIGYFEKSVVDFDQYPEGAGKGGYITRWRLEPRAEDMRKYLQGELVEPRKPIVFYIDPATPKKWVPYLMKGVSDWQAAFERAGFKNAIYAKPAPDKDEDPAWTIADSRYSTIVYMASTTNDASYSTVVDPRSGEIIESHIKWYHNIISRLRDFYFVQAAACDKKAQRMVFDDELMGELIRSVCAHEIGHALGFPHNFKASAAIPVEKLRDKKWVEQHGTTASIMDYARFNYVAQPEDNIDRRGLLPYVGEYDKWAVEWGYRLIPDAKSAAEERIVLDRWIAAKSGDRIYSFSSDGFSSVDPRIQSEDLGDDAVKAGNYGIENLKYLTAHLVEFLNGRDPVNKGVREFYPLIQSQFEGYLTNVTRYVGGVLEEYGPKGLIYKEVPKQTQEGAVDFLKAQIFTPPGWLLNDDILKRVPQNGADFICRVQSNVLWNLMNEDTWQRLLTAEQQHKDEGYKVADLLKELHRFIFGNNELDVYRINLQKAYVANLIQLTKYAGNSASSRVMIPFIARKELLMLNDEISRDKERVASELGRFHLDNLLSEISTALQRR